MALFITFAQTAAAAEAAAAAAAAASTAAAAASTGTTLAAGAGALGSMSGSAALPTALEATTAMPQLAGTASTLAEASPEIANNLAQAGNQGIMQSLTPDAVQNAATSAGAGAGSGYPTPTATTGEVPNIAGQVSAQPLNPAGSQPPVAPPAGAPPVNSMQGITQTPFGDVATPSAAQPINGSPFTPPVVQPPSAVPPVTPAEPSGGIMNSLQRGFNLAKDFASSAYEGYKKAPAPLQYLGAGLAAKKLGMMDQEQPAKKTYAKQDMSQFRAWSPSPYPVPGRAGFADGGPVETMSNMNTGVATAPGMNTTGGNMYYPMAQQPHLGYINPGIQNPISQNVLDVGDAGRLDPYTGMPSFAEGGVPNYKALLEGKTPDEIERDSAKARATAERFGVGIVPRSRAQSLMSPATAAQAELSAMMKKYGIKSALPKIKDPQESTADVQEAASGGIMHGLGGYSDGGRLLKGPGDGVSDSIPAMIGDKQPARLADGEFVVPSRIVSELGNGSTEAGARKLYAMMDRVQKGRKKSVGKGKVAVDSKADKHLPA